MKNIKEASQDFTRFERRLSLCGTLTVETGLRIGTGRNDEASDADIAVMKDALRRPFVPGSSFKGALRAQVERIVRTLRAEAYQCDPLDNRARCITADKLDAQRKSQKSQAEIAQWILTTACPVCRVFGSPWLASKVQVRDLTLAEPEFWSERRYEMRAGVGIERDSETAQAGILYKSQLVSPGTAFKWEVVIENADPDLEEPLVILGLREMLHGRVPLGGGRSRGLGRVTLNDLDCTVVTRENLIAYLASGQGAPVTWPHLEQAITPCLQAWVEG